jgi:hypothetical protein
MPRNLLKLVVLLTLAGMSSGWGADLVVRGSAWKYLLGTNDASSPIEYWQSRDFDDGQWEVGTTPIGYGEAVTKNIGSSLAGGWLSLYMRQTFVLTNPGDVSELNFEATVDDSFIVWINGHEIARYNIPTNAPPGELVWNAPDQYTFSAIEPTASTFTITNDLATFLTPGVNVLAAHVFNANWTSSDLYFDASLTARIDDTHPVVSSLIPTAGSQVRQLTQIEVQFSKSVAGVDAADLLINGVGATALSVIAPWQYVFEFPQPATGLVQVAWSADHGIHDLTTASNVLPGGQWTYTLDTNTPMRQIILSEFMADNKKTLNDGDGDSSDWIELLNTGTVAVDLSNWRLTPKADKSEQWRFPAVTLGVNKYLVVFASGKDRTNAAAPLHTDFKLAKEGGYLGLLDPTGIVVSEFPSYPVQFQDVSYGRSQGALAAGYFTTPTPGAANAVSGAGFAPEVDYSRRSGTFTTTFQLALSTASTNAVIRYVLGTNMPTETSASYAAPLTISNTTVIRARAFETGLLPGPVVTASFIQLASDVVKFSSDLPIVVLHNLGRGDVPASTDQYVSIQVFEPATGPSALTNTPSLATSGIFHKRGSSTLGIAKASFFVETQDEYGNDKNVSFAGLPKESDWVLYAPNNYEPVLIHNPMAHALSRQAGRYSPGTQFVEVYLKDDSGALRSADYNGIYVLEEKIKIGANRVDIDKLEPEHTTVLKVTGGYLLSIDRSAAGTSPFSAGNASINYLDPDFFDMQTPQRASQAQYIKNYINSFYTVLNGANWQDPLKGYAAYIDVPAWLDHHILNVVTFNVDALRLSGYFYKPREGKLTMGPLWDFDRTQGSTDGRDFNPRTWRSTVTWDDKGTDMFNSDWLFQNPWYSRLVRDIDFWQKWIDRYQDLRSGVLANTNIYAMIDSLSGQVLKAQPRETSKWGTLTAPRAGRWSAGGYTYTFPGTYQGEVTFMKLWYSNRLDFIDTNFVRRPRISETGGKVALEGPTGVPVYYTIDGSDPRMAGGGISPGARPYSEPITLNANARVVARAFDVTHHNLTGTNNPPLSSSWSGPVSLLHLVSLPDLVVTEIMYHPAPEPGSTNDAELYEYIELLNRGTNTLNLAGFRFTQGIDFVFPSLDLAAGQRVLVVRDRAAFEFRYGTNRLIAGAFTNQLNNAGERLVLAGPLGEPILDFTYNNSWYPATDGLGFSLVITDEQAPLAGWNNRLNWRVSSALQGSPGATDGNPPPIPMVLVNEVLANTDPPQYDTVELYNPGPTPADIGGWFLTDDKDQPKKMRIPQGTLVPPNGYVTFDESSFTNLGPDSFRFSSEGDSVWLFSGDAQTNLTGYAHGFAFGASAKGTSFGRHVTSDGRELFVAQAELSLGTNNAGPRVGPVVINEIMADPLPVYLDHDNTRDEYVELRNITLQPVPLYDPDAVTNTWRLRGAVDFDFPMNQVLPPGGFLLLVSFDPILDVAELAAFRQRYSLNTDTVILGPYAGRLNNSGESLRLVLQNLSPLASTIPCPANAPYIVVDEVDYNVVAPWPDNVTASTNSLQRIASAAFGNDPANWRGAVATPGAPNIGANSDSDGDGLPDDWEMNFFWGLSHDGQADSDGDGLTDEQEYLAGTSPVSASDCLKIEMASHQEGQCVLCFQGVAGKTYTVQFRDAFPMGGWEKLTDVPAPVANGMINVTNRISNGRYYRLLTPAAP